MKLNLGCGRDYKEGYINIDLDKNIKTDINTNVLCLPFENNSIDEIFSSHLVEHQHNNYIEVMFKEWYRILKVKGIVIIRCPNFKIYLKEFLEMQEDDPLKYTWGIINIYGHSHLGEGMQTRTGFTLLRLKKCLEKVGFKTLECKEIETRNNDINNIEYRKNGDLFYRGIKSENFVY